MRFSRIAIFLAALFCGSALAQDLPLTISTGGQIQRLQSGRAIQGQAPTTANPTLILPEGTAPTSPANGACWVTTAGMFCHTSVGGTMGPFGALSSVATLNILANLTGGSAAPIGHTLSDTIDSAIGSAQGDILYRGASSWSILAPGTSGFFLKTQGASANPVWAAATGGTGNVVATGSATAAQCFLSDGTSSPYGATVGSCAGGGSGGFVKVCAISVASSGTEADFSTANGCSLSSTYSSYVLYTDIWSNSNSSGTTSSIGFQFSTDGGSSYDVTAGDYSYILSVAFNGGVASVNSNGFTALIMEVNTIGNGASNVTNVGQTVFPDLSDTTTSANKCISGSMSAPSTIIPFMGCWNNTSTAVNAFRLISTTGTFQYHGTLFGVVR